MKYIGANNYRLEIGSLEDSSLLELLESHYSQAKKIIIVDENTHVNCLEYLVTTFEPLNDAEVILLPAGEDSKQLMIAGNVWEALTDYGVTRHDLIINLGGGVITDMGGFIASCFKRGLAFINIPTSLLGMVDASIGGKTGVNLGPYKNQVGVFSNPVAVYIDQRFLQTLPEEEMLSGFAEMIKHGLIHDRKLFQQVLRAIKSKEMPSNELLVACIEVKNKVVLEDPLEKGPRKVLNFGHTIGHVIEGHFIGKKFLSHGHSIAIGMVMEAYLSFKKGLLPEGVFIEIQDAILEHYEIPKYSNDEISEMVEMLSNDKKNKQGKILCCLLRGFGKCEYDHAIREEQFVEVFLHFKNLQINLN